MIDKSDRDAEQDFGLAPERNVLAFIGNSGLDRPQYINTDVYRNWKGPSPAPLVDAYHFYAGTKYGYIAFLRNPTNGQWLIKSFHLERTKPDPRNFSFSDLRDQPAIKAFWKRLKGDA